MERQQQIPEYIKAKEFPAYTWPGVYPIFYMTADDSVLCPACANKEIALVNDPHDRQWYIIATDVNWEDDSLFCDHCNKRIESAYGESSDDE